MEIQSSDWVKIIIAIIGAVATIVSAIIEKGGGFPKIKLSISKILTIILVVILVWTIYPILKGTTVQITSLNNNDKVEMCEIVQGKVTRLPSENKIWLLVQTSITDHVFPQVETAVAKNGEWSGQVCMGQENENGMKFSVIVVLADSQAHQEFADHRDASTKSRDFSGMVGLPNGADEYDRVIVIRK